MGIRAGVLFTVASAVAACASSAPSSTPLSPPVPVPPGDPRTSSSRYVGPEQTDQPAEPAPGSEVVIDDDDDDSTARGERRPPEEDARPSSARGTTCAPRSGPPPSCAELPPDPNCIGASIARRVCETFGPSLDPAVASAWVGCLVKSARDQNACETSRVVSCALRALSSACVDGAHHAQCEHVAATCSDFAPEITVSVCESATGAFKPEGRARIVDCLEHGCETGSFGACLP